METPIENKNSRYVLFVDNDRGFGNEVEDLAKRMEIESKHGYHIDHASDLVSGMKALEKNSYELVILELVLPILSGYLLIEKIKAKYPNTRIIVYTRLKAPQDLAKTASSGVDDIYLKELISLEELIKQIISGAKSADITETLKRLNEKSKELMSQEVRTNNLLTQCSKCHLMIAPDSYFCNNCGQKIPRKEEKILLQKPAGKKNEDGKAVEIKGQKKTDEKDDKKKESDDQSKERKTDEKEEGKPSDEKIKAEEKEAEEDKEPAQEAGKEVSENDKTSEPVETDEKDDKPEESEPSDKKDEEVKEVDKTEVKEDENNPQ